MRSRLGSSLWRHAGLRSLVWLALALLPLPSGSSASTTAGGFTTLAPTTPATNISTTPIPTTAAATTARATTGPAAATTAIATTRAPTTASATTPAPTTAALPFTTTTPAPTTASVTTPAPTTALLFNTTTPPPTTATPSTPAATTADLRFSSTAVFPTPSDSTFPAAATTAPPVSTSTANFPSTNFSSTPVISTPSTPAPTPLPTSGSTAAAATTAPAIPTSSAAPTPAPTPSASCTGSYILLQEVETINQDKYRAAFAYCVEQELGVYAQVINIAPSQSDSALTEVEFVVHHRLADPDVRATFSKVVEMMRNPHSLMRDGDRAYTLANFKTFSVGTHHSRYGCPRDSYGELPLDDLGEDIWTVRNSAARPGMCWASGVLLLLLGTLY